MFLSLSRPFTWNQILYRGLFSGTSSYAFGRDTDRDVIILEHALVHACSSLFYQKSLRSQYFYFISTLFLLKLSRTLCQTWIDPNWKILYLESELTKYYDFSSAKT
jgi:hypothetical protein